MRRNTPNPQGGWLAGFARRCREAREFAGYGQAQVSKMAGRVAAQSVSQLETGITQRISARMMDAYLSVAQGAGVSRSWLLTGEGVMVPANGGAAPPACGQANEHVIRIVIEQGPRA